MAKLEPVEVVVKVKGLDEILDALTKLDGIQSAAWEAGMRHALAWLGLKQYGDVMALDNPHRETA